MRRSLAVVLVAFALLASGAAARNGGVGRGLYLENCASCHGADARGIPKSGPALVGTGAQAADFYLRTGRMPLDDPSHEPLRGDSPYTAEQLDALVAYLGSLGGPRVPVVHAQRGSLSRGFRLFAQYCMGCHQAVGAGGIAPGAIAPELSKATPTQVAEAIRIGPFAMPKFSQRQLTRRDIDDLAAYVDYTQHPKDEGGWSLGHVGPVPEGMVAWLVGLALLVAFVRIIGERNDR